MYKSETHIRVRYAETDQMGYVYYGNYATYYEVARVESLRKLGLTYKSIEKLGVIMPVLENYSKFIAPAKYDDHLRIETTIKKKPGVRVKFTYEIYNEENKLLNIGETTLVFVDVEKGTPCDPPGLIMDKLTEYFDG